MTQTSTLRAALRQPGMTIAPGAYDGLTAMLVAQAGFPAIYMTGAGTSVSHGYPDFGLLTETEMVANAARMVRFDGDPRRFQAGIPLIALCRFSRPPLPFQCRGRDIDRTREMARCELILRPHVDDDDVTLRQPVQEVLPRDGI